MLDGPYKRKWKHKSIFITVGCILLLLFYGNIIYDELTMKDHVAMIDINGTITKNNPFANAKNTIQSLNNAVNDSHTKGIVLNINSPGGNPTQTTLIYDEIIRIRHLKPSLPVYAVIEEIGASGGYYIAVAADKIYSSRASMVGSIGVVAIRMDFSKLAQHMGISDKSVYTGSYKHNSLTDSPSEKSLEHMKDMADVIFEQFKSVVIYSRGSKITELNYDEVFSGKVWVGEKALNLGLIDGFEPIGNITRKLIQVDGNIKNFTYEPDLISQLGGMFQFKLF